MATNKRRVRKNHETSTQNGGKALLGGGYNQKTLGDVRNASKSQEKMKKDWGPKGTTMNRKLGK